MHQQHKTRKKKLNLSTFYSMLDNIEAQCKSQEVIITMGDQIVKVGKETVREIAI